MKFYTFYNIETGKINRNSFLEDAVVEFNVQTGEGYLEGRFDGATQKIVDGAVVDIENSIIEENELQEAWASFYETRGALLFDSDWTQVSDSPLSESKKTEWQTYRQALRDMPSQEGFDPLNPTYPTEPS